MRAGWVTWAGLAVVLAAAAVLSFAALADLAHSVGINARVGRLELAWLLPVCVDAGAAVSTGVWLTDDRDEARQFARRLTWALLALTVAGNATHQGLTAAAVVPPWWLAVVVGAVPPAVVGAVVHVAVLVGRAPEDLGQEGRAEEGSGEPSFSEDLDDAMSVEHLDEHGLSRFWKTAPPTGEPPVARTEAPDDRAALLIAEGVGRRRLARELGVTEHEARALLDARRNGSAVTS